LSYKTINKGLALFHPNNGMKTAPQCPELNKLPQSSILGTSLVHPWYIHCKMRACYGAETSAIIIQQKKN